MGRNIKAAHIDRAVRYLKSERAGFIHGFFRDINSAYQTFKGCLVQKITVFWENSRKVHHIFCRYKPRGNEDIVR